jgi:hypothetical protein
MSNLPNNLTLSDQFNQIKLTQSNPQSNTMDDYLRLNLLNDTYRKRYIDYIKIILVTVITLICIWLCRILENMDYISSSVGNFILIIIIGVSLIIVYLMYNDIQKHNLIVYDEIDYWSPELIKQDLTTSTDGSSSTISPDSISDGKCSAPIKKNVLSTSMDSSSFISASKDLFGWTSSE